MPANASVKSRRDLNSIFCSLRRRSACGASIFDADLFRLLWKQDLIGQAAMQVLSAKGAKTSGVDHVTVRDFRKSGRLDLTAVDAFGQDLSTNLREGRYRPQPARAVHIAKPKGGTRRINVPTIRDRVVMTALWLILDAIFEPTFAECAHGFRTGRSTRTAVNAALSWLNDGRNPEAIWSCTIDVRRCFDELTHDRVRKALDRKISGRGHRFRKLTQKLIGLPTRDGKHDLSTTVGIPQGSALSPILLNAVLTPMDQAISTTLSENSAPSLYLRYADDLLLLIEGTLEEALAGVRVITDAVQAMGLRVKPDGPMPLRAVCSGCRWLGVELTYNGLFQAAIPTHAIEHAADHLARMVMSAVVGNRSKVRTLNVFRGWYAYVKTMTEAPEGQAALRTLKTRLRSTLERAGFRISPAALPILWNLDVVLPGPPLLGAGEYTLIVDNEGRCRWGRQRPTTAADAAVVRPLHPLASFPA